MKDYISTEVLTRLQETNTDLKILASNILKASETNHLLQGYNETIQRWIELNEAAIQKATT